MGWIAILVATVVIYVVAEWCSKSGCRTGLILCGVGLVLMFVAAFIATSRGTMYVEREPTAFDAVHEEYRYLED